MPVLPEWFENKAPGPGRDFDGCPKECGSIILITGVFVGGWIATMRYFGGKSRDRKPYYDK